MVGTILKEKAIEIKKNEDCQGSEGQVIPNPPLPSAEALGSGE